MPRHLLVSYDVTDDRGEIADDKGVAPAAGEASGRSGARLRATLHSLWAVLRRHGDRWDRQLHRDGRGDLILRNESRVAGFADRTPRLTRLESPSIFVGPEVIEMESESRSRGRLRKGLVRGLSSSAQGAVQVRITRWDG